MRELPNFEFTGDKKPFAVGVPVGKRVRHVSSHSRICVECILDRWCVIYNEYSWLYNI